MGGRAGIPKTNNDNKAGAVGAGVRWGMDDKLIGWGAIESFAGWSRNTLLSRKYPIYKEGGSVWARKSEIEAFMVKNAVFIPSNSVNCCQELSK